MQGIKGTDLPAWRQAHGYSQDDLRKELGVKSRQTISTWENDKRELPRTLQLALMALARIPEARNIFGKKTSPSEWRSYAKQKEIEQ